MSYYDAKIRGQLRSAVIATGTKPNRADQVVDLACHAAEEGFDRVFGVLKTAPDTGIGMMATELACQLAAQRLTHMFEIIHAKGREAGVPFAAAVVGG